MNRRRGLTILELLFAVSIISVVIGFGIPEFKSFFVRAQMNSSLRLIHSSINTARYKAIEMNKRIKFSIKNNKIVLQEKKRKEWEAFLYVSLKENVSASINSSPVFHPAGFVSPLCSIIVKNERHKYKISISIAGRIKVLRIK